MLAGALARVHLVSVFLLQLFLAQGDVGKACFLICDDPPHVVHKADVSEAAGVHLEMVEIVKVVVLLHLPELVTEAGASSWLCVEDDRFALLDYGGPFLLGAPQVDVLCGVAVVGPEQDVEQVVPPLSLRDAPLDEVAVVLVGAVQVTAGEVGPDVSGDHPAVLGIVLRDDPDVLHELADGAVRAVADAVVKGPVCELVFYQRADVEVEVVLEYFALHQAGDDLPGPGAWCNESV